MHQSVKIYCIRSNPENQQEQTSSLESQGASRVLIWKLWSKSHQVLEYVIFWVSLCDHYPNNSAGTCFFFFSWHSFIFLMWLEKECEHFLRSVLQSPTIPLRAAAGEKRNNWDNRRAASPGSEVRAQLKRCIVLGLDRCRQETAESCAWWNILLWKLLLTLSFFFSFFFVRPPRRCRMSGEHSVCFLYTSFGGCADWEIALKLRPKLRQDGEARSQCWYMYTCELFTCRPAGNEER